MASHSRLDLNKNTRFYADSKVCGCRWENTSAYLGLSSVELTKVCGTLILTSLNAIFARSNVRLHFRFIKAANHTQSFFRNK